MSGEDIVGSDLSRACSDGSFERKRTSAEPAAAPSKCITQLGRVYRSAAAWTAVLYTRLSHYTVCLYLQHSNHTMAPGRIDSPTERSENIATNKPTVYLLDELHPDAVKHAQAKFNTILPSDPKHANWRENAEYLVIRGSYLRKEDVEACKKLKAVGKQGVGKSKLCGLLNCRQMLTCMERNRQARRRSMQGAWHPNLQHTRRQRPSRCRNRPFLNNVCGSTSRPHNRTPDTRRGRSQGNMLRTHHPQQDHRYCWHGQHRSEGRCHLPGWARV